MNDLIKNSIDSRIDCIYNSYEVDDESIKDDIIDIKNRLYELGRTCVDVGEFETKLAGSSLNQEYIDLFTKLAMNCRIKGQTFEDEENIIDEIGYEISYQVSKRVKQDTYDKVKDISVVGEILNAKQYSDFFNKYKK